MCRGGTGDPVRRGPAPRLRGANGFVGLDGLVGVEAAAPRAADPCDAAGRGGSPAAADRAGPDRAALWLRRGGSGASNRGCASGVDAGRGQASGRRASSSGGRICRERDAAGRSAVLLLAATWWTRRLRGTLDGVGSPRPRLAALSAVSSSADSRRKIASSLEIGASLPADSVGARRCSAASASAVSVAAGRTPSPATSGSMPIISTPRRGEQHQRETFDQRIATVDQQVFEAGELGAVKQPVRAGHRAEQDQRWLDDRGEDTGLANRQHRSHATRHIQRGEDGRQLLAGSGVEGEARSGPGNGDQPRRPTRAHQECWGLSSDDPTATADCVRCADTCRPYRLSAERLVKTSLAGRGRASSRAAELSYT